jgi:hypothetical protein
VFFRHRSTLDPPETFTRVIDARHCAYDGGKCNRSISRVWPEQSAAQAGSCYSVACLEPKLLEITTMAKDKKKKDSKKDVKKKDVKKKDDKKGKKKGKK